MRSAVASTSSTQIYPIPHRPARPFCSRLFGGYHHPAYRGVPAVNTVYERDYRAISASPRAPAHDRGIERLGGLHICRGQLVPDETAMLNQPCLFLAFERGKVVEMRAFEPTELTFCHQVL